MPSFNKQKLLEEVIRDGRYEQFRARAFRAGLRTLRAKNSRALWPRRLALAAALVLLLGFSFTILHSTREVTVQQSAVPDGISLSSVPFAADRIVHSSRDNNILVKTRRTAAVETVETEHPPVIELSDQELLALFGNEPAGLVRAGNRTELLLLRD